MGRAQTRGLIGGGDLGVHLRHALGFVEILRVAGLPASILDLGSGGGLPGLVVADVLGGTPVTLLDSSERRCRLLREAVEECGWTPRVTVHHERAELAAHRAELRGAFDAVVARSFGAPAVTAECGAAFLSPDGVLVASEPPAEVRAGDGGPESRWPAEGLALLGLEADAAPEGEFAYRVLRRRGDCPDRYPRRPGVPARRPLF